MWVQVYVEVGNLHPPRFTQHHYEAHVPDTVAPGTELLQVRALDGDLDPHADVHYSLLKGEACGAVKLFDACSTNPSKEERSPYPQSR